MRMELTREQNVSTAADPQAINAAVPSKQPVADNDPTRNVSARERIERALLIGMVVLALVLLVLATFWVFVGR